MHTNNYVQTQEVQYAHEQPRQDPETNRPLIHHRIKKEMRYKRQKNHTWHRTLRPRSNTDDNRTRHQKKDQKARRKK
eukprot:scaffold336280_cov24-Attheya_sp.AAC.1